MCQESDSVSSTDTGTGSDTEGSIATQHSAVPTSQAEAPITGAQAGEETDDTIAARDLAASPSRSTPNPYGIVPVKITSGEDQRTTVLVEHLAGLAPRAAFLNFLDESKLGDSYKFFYLLSQTHRHVPENFAFVVFKSPLHVLRFVHLIECRAWINRVEATPGHSLAVKYARFQGKEEILKHLQRSKPAWRPLTQVTTAKYERRSAWERMSF